MVEKDDLPLSPTVAKVLDAFLEAMKSDEKIDNAAAERLDALLREGKAPKQDEIDDALFPTSTEEKQGEAS